MLRKDILRIPSSITIFRRAIFGRATFTAAFALICGGIGFAQSNPLREKEAWDAFAQTSSPAETVHYLSRGTEKQELEIYLPSGAAKTTKARPVLLLVHGGGWSGGAREALAPHARYFAALGWVCVNISYRLTSKPGVTLMKAADDVRAAFDWVRAEAPRRGWDPNRISAFGESAGGQLACALGVLPPEAKRWRAHALVLINPVLDLTTLNWALSVPGVREGGPIDPATIATHPAWTVSPLFHLTADSPPMLLLHGRKDVTVPVAQTEAFAAAAKKAGAKVELVVLENAAHAFLLHGYGEPDTMRLALRHAAQFLGDP